MLLKMLAWFYHVLPPPPKKGFVFVFGGVYSIFGGFNMFFEKVGQRLSCRN